MDILPVNITELISVVLGMMIVLIPVAGITLRFALKPTAETLARFFDQRNVGDAVGILERRVAFLESQLESVERSVDQVAAATEFDRRLGAGGQGEGDEAGPAA